MAVVGTDVERYSDPSAFAKEVNLPLLGAASLQPVAPGSTLADLLAASAADGLEPIVENLAQTRQSLTLRSLLVAGFAHDPECFALGLALGRAWSRRGLRIAVVDMDAWNPTIVRAPGEPAEGLVDVLEYGCSFQRVAWELVAGSLWVVGPGMHAAEEARLADHPEWDRAARVFAARVDVTLYVAPFLHKPGLTGRLSKRMDGVLLASSVERVGRAELRDAFLELWGSDAPIIGCVAIDPRSAPAPATRRTATPHVDQVPAVAAGDPVAAGAGAPIPPHVARATAAPRPQAPPPRQVPPPPAHDTAAADVRESALVAALEREVRTGGVASRSPRRGGASTLSKILTGGAIVAAAAAIWIIFLLPGPPRPVGGDARTAGDETVLPAPEMPAGEPSAGAPSSVAPPGGASIGGVSGASPTVSANLALGSSAPLTAAPPAEGKPYLVHVASFRSEEKVAALVRGLRLKGLDAWYEKVPDDSGWYRVFVGRFATEDEANAYANWLLQNKWVERAHAYIPTSR